MPPTSDAANDRDQLALRVRDLEQALASVLAILPKARWPGDERQPKAKQNQTIADEAARVLSARRTPDVPPGTAQREELLMLAATAIHAAFGAPGDFGYETREGHALQCLYAAMGGRQVDWRKGLPSALANEGREDEPRDPRPRWLDAGEIPVESDDPKNTGYIRFAPHLGHAVGSNIAVDFTDERWRREAASVRWFGPFPLWPT